ncbi:MAG: 2-keto-3-deoxy-L-rhamnonate aldolase [Planctomycetes bacterium]|nr:2-keto-3-deoxy-L-rhamnonate aldolase [Planctomycetota bacterium]
MPGDPFTNPQGKARRLFAAAVNSGSTRVAEMAGLLGFDVIWIEMEHTSADLAAAEAMCVAAKAGGAIPLVRTAGYRREHILHALEVGGRIIVVPMVNDAEAAREVVRHGKFRPLGQRGFNTRSRALGYGLDPASMARANEETCLLPQIETLEAVRRLDEILAVDGLGGIFVGPGDLSADLGRPGRFDDPDLRAMVVGCVAKARARGLHAGVFAGEGPLFEESARAGADLFIAASDLQAAITLWQQQLQRLTAWRT